MRAGARRRREGGRRQRAGAAGVRVGWDLGAEVDLGSKMSGFRVSGDYMVGWTAGIGVLGLLARDLGGRPNSAEKFDRHGIFFGTHRNIRNFGFFGEISPKLFSLL